MPRSLFASISSCTALFRINRLDLGSMHEFQLGLWVKLVIFLGKTLAEFLIKAVKLCSLAVDRIFWVTPRNESRREIKQLTEHTIVEIFNADNTYSPNSIVLDLGNKIPRAAKVE